MSAFNNLSHDAERESQREKAASLLSKVNRLDCDWGVRYELSDIELDLSKDGSWTIYGHTMTEDVAAGKDSNVLRALFEAAFPRL